MKNVKSSKQVVCCILCYLRENELFDYQTNRKVYFFEKNKYLFFPPCRDET